MNVFGQIRNESDRNSAGVIPKLVFRAEVALFVNHEAVSNSEDEAAEDTDYELTSDDEAEELEDIENISEDEPIEVEVSEAGANEVKVVDGGAEYEDEDEEVEDEEEYEGEEEEYEDEEEEYKGEKGDEDTEIRNNVGGDPTDDDNEE
ncbi:unnamed protein product [Somion occarium]|uniref:Uncharacterized protein n=1 Tax=Somion occarium TaxID=3059160 RepID=A0ABP1DX23_9APHY